METNKLFEEYLSKESWLVKENSNMGYSLQGLNNHIVGEVTKKYWETIYNEKNPKIMEAHKKGFIHAHDLSSLSSYTYYGKEVIVAKYKGELLLLSFEDIYDLVDCEEVLLNKEDNAFAKYPKELYVMDKDGWTKTTRLVKKEKNREMHFIKNKAGRSVIVTDNHPMIVGLNDNGRVEKDASTVTFDDKTYNVDLKNLLKDEKIFNIDKIDLLYEFKKMNKTFIGNSKIYFNGRPISEIDIEHLPEDAGYIHTASYSISRHITLNKEFGYLLGFLLGDGHVRKSANSNTTHITQKNPDILYDIVNRLVDNGLVGCVNKREKSGMYDLRIANFFLKFICGDIFKMKYGSYNKNLPTNILSYNKDFVLGVIGGLIDSDGSKRLSWKGKFSGVVFRVVSRTMVMQLSTLLPLLGFYPRDGKPQGVGSIREYDGREIKQNFPIFPVTFSKTETDIFSKKYDECEIAKKTYLGEEFDIWSSVTNNDIVPIKDEWIYDITTETNTLMVNGMWNHNCMGLDLGDIIKNGFGGVGGKMESKPPKHFKTALLQIVNYMYTIQGETAGAVALSNFDTLLAPYMFYDGLNYAEVKQAMQEFVFNMNVPTRVGFQCLSEDTEILTTDGWKMHNDIDINTVIWTYDMKVNKMEMLPVEKMFKREYSGKMYSFLNDSNLISPQHRVAILNPEEDKMSLKTIENIISDGSDFTIRTIVDGVFVHDYEDITISVDSIKEEDYSGIIWCPSTKNETLIARRNGTVFITGNCPFSNITMDLKVPSMFKDKKVIIGGKEQIETYGEFQKEMDVLNMAFTDVMMEGDGKGRPFSFPIPTYSVVKDIDWSHKVMKKVLAMTAKYGTPYFANYLNSDMTPESARSMCCRLRLDNKEIMKHLEKKSFQISDAIANQKEGEHIDIKRRGSLFGSNPLTGSVHVTTINIPRLMYLSKGDEIKFYELLREYMDICKEMHEIKRKIIEKLTNEGLYPYLAVALRDVKAISGEYWSNHFSTIGFLGMHDGLVNFGIKDGILSEKGVTMAKEVMNFMRDVIDEYSHETETLYNLEATPAEGASYRLALIDKKEFSDIITDGTEETPYYNNSVFPPLDMLISPIDVVEHQSQLHKIFNGGVVFHFHFGEKITDTASLGKFIYTICKNYEMPYISITPIYSICPNCGFMHGEHFICPTCNSEAEVYSRVVGYYRPVQFWNNGKVQEFSEREKFTELSIKETVQKLEEKL